VDGDGYPDPDWNPSWFQYTMLKQIDEWDFELSLPDKCDDIATETSDCVDSADHFVDRRTYEINPTVIQDERSSELNNPVISPAKIIEVQSSSSQP
jgi:hypothetical protein